MNTNFSHILQNNFSHSLECLESFWGDTKCLISFLFLKNKPKQTYLALNAAEGGLDVCQNQDSQNGNSWEIKCFLDI